jgi:peroxiredoxin Q/BCP
MLGKPLPVGAMAPDFTAQDHTGQEVRLSELRGRPVVLVFYPGDDTPGCTAQLCELRDAWKALEAAGAAVYGVNPAGEARHRGFVEKYHFPFPLLVDRGGRIARMYRCGLWLLVRRTVYVLDAEGRVGYAARGKPTPVALLSAMLRFGKG